jgi:hypothetical protein
MGKNTFSMGKNTFSMGKKYFFYGQKYFFFMGKKYLPSIKAEIEYRAKGLKFLMATQLDRK